MHSFKADKYSYVNLTESLGRRPDTDFKLSKICLCLLKLQYNSNINIQPPIGSNNCTIPLWNA